MRRCLLHVRNFQRVIGTGRKQVGNLDRGREPVHALSHSLLSGSPCLGLLLAGTSVEPASFLPPAHWMSCRSVRPFSSAERDACFMCNVQESRSRFQCSFSKLLRLREREMDGTWNSHVTWASEDWNAAILWTEPPKTQGPAGYWGARRSSGRLFTLGGCSLGTRHTDLPEGNLHLST